GVAVTTFRTLSSLSKPEGVDVTVLVVDEAHYIKNPTAERTKEVRRWIDGVDRVLFLTGTPMENRVEEFRTLVGHLQPEVARRIPTTVGIAGAKPFQKAVAPAYLRRNQEDVLQELPPRVDTEEWVQLEKDDLAAYR